jgi:hypothetical protein
MSHHSTLLGGFLHAGAPGAATAGRAVAVDSSAKNAPAMRLKECILSGS